MKLTLTLLTALLLAPLVLLPNTSAAEPKTQSAWPFTTENGLFHLWLPKDVPAIKGLLVFPYHGTGEQWSESPEVQDLAKELSCGIVAFDQLGKLPDGTQLGFPGNQKSPDARLLDAFAELAKQSGHREVVNGSNSAIPPAWHDSKNRFTSTERLWSQTPSSTPTSFCSCHETHLHPDLLTQTS